MKYRPIPLPTTVPPQICEVVANRVDPFLSDVHAMLHLPRPELGVEAGCNFAAIEVLCAFISGMSRVFLTTKLGTDKAFRDILAFYPTEVDLRSMPRAQFIDHLYTTFRCNFSHSLGINVPNPQVGSGTRKIEPLPQRTKIVRYGPGVLTPEFLAALDDTAKRPDGLHPTMYMEGGAANLCVEALYWGCRKMVLNVAADTACISNATDFLRGSHGSGALGGRGTLIGGGAPVGGQLYFEVSSSSEIVMTNTVFPPSATADKPFELK